MLAIPAYVAGKPPVAREGLTSYKLSSNENPYPPLPGVLEAATEAAAQMNRYPDMGSTALYAALGEAMGVPVDDLAAATGSVGLIYQLVNAFCDPGDEVVYAWRSFEAYPIAVTAGGATSVQVPLTADGRHDLDAMAAAVTDRTKVVIVCTPNNPTGPAVTQTDLDAFIAKVPTHVVVVVDEAYLEFVRMDDAIDGVATYRRHDNVVLTRTFSKAYGLAGFRRRLRRRPRADRRRAPRGLAAVRRQPRRPGRRDRLAGGRATSCSRASTTSSSAVPTWSPGCARWAGSCPTRRATSSGSRWATAPSTSPRRAASSGSRSGPSPAPAYASASGRPRPSTGSSRWRPASP